MYIIIHGHGNSCLKQKEQWIVAVVSLHSIVDVYIYASPKDLKSAIQDLDDLIIHSEPSDRMPKIALLLWHVLGTLDLYSPIIWSSLAS